MTFRCLSALFMAESSYEEEHKGRDFAALEEDATPIWRSHKVPLFIDLPRFLKVDVTVATRLRDFGVATVKSLDYCLINLHADHQIFLDALALQAGIPECLIDRLIRWLSAIPELRFQDRFDGPTLSLE